MLRISTIILLTILLCQSAFSQSITWTQTIPGSGIFSSPRSADLNEDGVKDIVIGGGMELAPSAVGVTAFDGTDGSILWQTFTRDQVFGSAIFRDITGDGIPEIFIGGRSGMFMAINGMDGNIEWEVDTALLYDLPVPYFLNFYTGQWVEDRNGDGYLDIVNVHGGYPPAMPTDSVRPPAFLYCISSKDGTIIGVDTIPDHAESYSSPLAIDLLRDGNIEVLYGSGGETLQGSWWMVSLDSLVAGNVKSSTKISTDTVQGFVAVPSLADLTGNGNWDIVIPRFNGRTEAFDLTTDTLLWSVEIAGSENYVSPVIGKFNADAVPDVVTILSIGTWPFYDYSIALLLDGTDGSELWRDTLSAFQLANGNALDWDNDGIDELLLIENYDTITSDTFHRFRLKVIDFNDASESIIYSNWGLNVFNTPLVEDIDSNGFLDIIMIWSPDSLNWYSFVGYKTARIETTVPAHDVSWGSYLGTNWNGTWEKNLSLMIGELEYSKPFNVNPNPACDIIYLPEIKGRCLIFNSGGELVMSFAENPVDVNINELTSGYYRILIFDKYKRYSSGFIVK